MSVLNVAIAQLNACLRDFGTNTQKIVAAAQQAAKQNADLLLTPELSLCGYPPEDLLLRPDFYEVAANELLRLADKLAVVAPNLTVVVGHPERLEGKNYNAASVLHGGKRLATYYKQYLPNSQVFDEIRYFTPGNQACVFDIAGTQCGLLICEDIWRPGVAEATAHAGAELLLVLNASPFHQTKLS